MGRPRMPLLCPPAPPHPPAPLPAADVDIDTLPRRRTDNARVLDQSKHLVKLYTADGGVKLLRRRGGAVERQHRLNVGRLPVAYTSEPGGSLLYVMDGAVTAFQKDPSAGRWGGGPRRGEVLPCAAHPAMYGVHFEMPEQLLRPRVRSAQWLCWQLWLLSCRFQAVFHAQTLTHEPPSAAPPSLLLLPAAASDRIPVPPCIRKGDSGSTEVTIEIEDRQPHATVAKITSDAVRVHLTGSISSDVAQQELLQLMSRVFNLRLTQMMVMRGAHSKQRLLTVEMLTPRQVYRALRGDGPKPGGRGDEAGGRGGGGRGGGGRDGGGRGGGGRDGGPGGGRGRGRRPWYAGL
jgi:uncharacterized membrane protein YgcG